MLCNCKGLQNFPPPPMPFLPSSPSPFPPLSISFLPFFPGRGKISITQWEKVRQSSDFMEIVFSCSSPKSLSRYHELSYLVVFSLPIWSLFLEGFGLSCLCSHTHAFPHMPHTQIFNLPKSSSLIRKLNWHVLSKAFTIFRHCLLTPLPRTRIHSSFCYLLSLFSVLSTFQHYNKIF